MKGFGTDEKMLIRTLCNKDPLQADLIRTTFDKTFKRSLIRDIKSETSGYFELGLVQLALGPLLADVNSLQDAIEGPGTNEAVLNDVLLGRSNADMKAIKSAYRQKVGRSLETDVKGDLSMKTERHFLMALAANRAEDAAPVVPRDVDEDVMQIYKATEGRMGTDELLVCQIMSSRSDDQIRAIAHTYKQKFNRDLDKVIQSVGRYTGYIRGRCLYRCSNMMLTISRNSPGICRMLSCSSSATPSTSTCTLPNCWRRLCVAWEPRTNCLYSVLFASTGITPCYQTSKQLIRSAIAEVWLIVSRRIFRETTRD
jgi:annexin A7/11